MVDSLLGTTDISILCPDKETTRTAMRGMISPDGLMLITSVSVIIHRERFIHLE